MENPELSGFAVQGAVPVNEGFADTPKSAMYRLMLAPIGKQLSLRSRVILKFPGAVRGACLAELGVEQTEERRSHRSM
jgi:hypothetical protein